MEKGKLMTLSEWDKQESKKYDGLQTGPNGIKCPICGEEMYDGDVRMMIATYPPKRKIYCKSCKHEDYKVL